MTYRSTIKSAYLDQLKLIRFALKYAGNWNSFAPDRYTVGAVCATVNLGIIKVNEFGQFKLYGSGVAARQWLNAK